MLPSQHWAQNFTVKPQDVEHITNLLLEKETPLSSYQITHLIVEQRLTQEREVLEERYKDAAVYNPSHVYEVGQRLVFPVMEYATGVITGMREGNNPDYGAFSVAAVEFEDESEREFATALEAEHPLNGGNGSSIAPDSLTVDEIMAEMEEPLVEQVETYLEENSDLISIAHKWFPMDLMLDVDDGHLNLTEAVLDINLGGPMKTRSILQEMGGLGKSHESLQEFSLNYYLNEDRRFDEVGPSGEVMWYLTRMEPEGVRQRPGLLKYSELPHNREYLTDDMRRLEAEIGDELSPLEPVTGIERGTVKLIYPHRRAGTLPLSAKIRDLFPRARNTSRIYVTLVDEADDEEFVGWVLPEERYIYGLGLLYTKYALPIGAHVTIKRSDDPGRIIVDLDTYKARSEWIPLMVPKGQQFGFETSKRAIGADYDDLMILGIDELEAVDALIETHRKQRQSLAATMKLLIPGLGQLNPQGTAHVQTIYSAVNVLRRCPPAPIMATLEANPDFENVGGHYWRVAD